MTLDVKRDQIINAAIPFVLERGWCEKALLEASVSLGEDAKYWGMYFVNLMDAVEYFEHHEDKRMLEVIASYGKLDGIRNRIGKALFERVVNISGGKRMLERLGEFYLQGYAMPSAVKNVWTTSDIIWRFAGDKATDFNHYTKRALLSGVYVAVVRRYLEDDCNIEQYVAESLDKVVNFGGKLGKLKNLKMEDIPILRMFS